MKQQLRNIIVTLLTLSTFVCLLTGCGNNTDVALESDFESAIFSEEQSPSVQMTSENIAEFDNSIENCPEGYVYDYQVSMEPIPKEIAELGGPCQGTIHAFPSKIGMALTELEMEKDPVLKAEVEKRIPEITAALEEEIGGEFVVDGVILIDDSSWYFFCTEVATGYQFQMNYANNEYFALKNNIAPIENVIVVQYYYNEKENIELCKEINPIIEEFYLDGDYKVRYQKSSNQIDIFIAQYRGNEVDKCIEQIKFLDLWEKLQKYNSEIDYYISVVYYPLEYRQVIEEKYTSTFNYDYSRFFREETVCSLKENKDIWCCLNYLGEEENSDMNALLQQYNTGKYNEDVIWEYWIQ